MAQAQQAQQAQQVKKAQKANIMVVDDEPYLRELLVDALAEPLLEVTAAASGKEAVELARTRDVDLVVADLYLGDCTGLEVIDRLREHQRDLPAVVITGSGDAESLSKASQRRPVELMNKPLDLDRLRQTIHDELARQASYRRRRRHVDRIRRVARDINADRKSIRIRFDRTCAALTASYRDLSSQMALQKIVLNYQNKLLSCKSDDDVFRIMFRLFVQRTGALSGVAMVCDQNAQLNVAGRFGVPVPDSGEFCKALTDPLIDAILANPQVMLIEAGEEFEMFDESIHRFLPGLSILLMPLIPGPGELIGLVAFYRKGEQPFTAGDIAVAEMIATPTAIAVRRND
ncbi:MAG: response regulator [Planctomycetes bacterium]|nr:response regulator [Planctomycetota bacterium]